MFRNNKAFTLLELVAVLSILTILVSLAFQPLQKMLDKEKLISEAKDLRVKLFKTRLSAIDSGKIIRNFGVVFYPNGRCTDKKFIIRNKTHKILIKMRGLTGRISVGKIEFDTPRLESGAD